MTQINVLVAIDVANAEALIAGGNNNVGQYVFMMDSTGYMGNGQGGHELTTHCKNGDTIVWSVVPIDPATTVSITGFSGSAIPDMINPAAYPHYGNTVWGGPVDKAGDGVQYSISLLLQGSAHGYFDPFITATNP